MRVQNPSLLDSPLLEPLLLRNASRRASALTDDARARMKPWVEAARARYAVALELRDRKTQPVALGLLREAAFFALCALEVAADAAARPASSAQLAWQRFERSAELSRAPAEVTLARVALGTDDALALDALSQAEVEALRPAAEETVRWLLGLTEIQTPQRLTLVRRVRSVGFIIGVSAFGWAVICYWLALAALARPGH